MTKVYSATRRFAFLVAVASGIGGVGAPAAADPGTVVQPGASPLPFTPFTLADVISPETGEPYYAGDTVTFKVDAATTFSGKIEDYLSAINGLEKQYNAMGQSLRQDGDILHKMLKDPDTLNGQMLNDLGLSVETVKPKLKGAVAVCETLSLAQLGVNATTGSAYAADERIVVDAGVTLTAGQFVARLNNVQKVLCTLGYSLLGELGGSGGLGNHDVVAALIGERNELLDRLGISRFDSKFDWQSIEDIKSFATLVADVDQTLAARQVPSPAQLELLRQQADAVLPADLQIPDLPNIPAPVPPKRQALAVKKRKDWSGFNEGDPSRFNAYATAYYEIRGTETVEEADAEGKAGVYVFGNEINVLDGFGQLYAGPDAVSGELKLTAFGQDVFEPLQFKEAVAYKVSDRKHFHFGKEVGFSQTFMIGPIPVAIAAGASAEAFVGWELAVLTIQLQGSITPGADVSAYIRGGVGFGGFLSAGAEGQIALLDLSPVLAGEAGIRFDPQGVPFLKLGLNADLVLSALDGHVDAYAEYPVPRFAIPPWTIKKSSLELFAWPGIHDDYKIFNWGLELTPFSVTMTGDLVDQTDRDETRNLQDLVDLEQRQQALADVEKQVAAKERAAFAAIDDDLGSAANVQIPAAAEALHQRQVAAAQERSGYLDELTRFASL